jgi:SPP1 family predicted phage head-tail adaptor
MINPGLMRERLTFQKTVGRTFDSMGNPFAQWEDFYRCKAYCNSFTADEAQEASADVKSADVKFFVRFSRKIADCDTRNTQVIFREQAYDITFIDNPNFKNEMLVISAKRKEV